MAILLFALLCSISTSAQKRYMVFANGYKGMKHDKITTTNGVSLEPDSYWLNYDDTLIKRFAPVVPVYIDGHHPLSTSPHRSAWRVYTSFVVSRFQWISRGKGRMLNDKPNLPGFQLRKEHGRICGQNFLQMIYPNDSSARPKDTLDIVCHSMGYSYALGFLSAVDDRFVLGKMLILSAESPGVEGYDWNKFQEVWQYGSNRGEKDADIICRQDGIAPQCAVKNIEQLEKGKGGRYFVPRHAKHGFIRSHHLNWYGWFFEVRRGDWGYFGR
jgi:hypothetical protein